MRKTISLILCVAGLYSCKQADNQDARVMSNPVVWEGSTATSNNVYDGIQYIQKAFDQYDLVAIGEHHGIREVTDFYIDLVKNEAFRKKVDVIVFELGNALYQGILDDYIMGRNNDSLQIKKVWRDHTSSFLQTGDRTAVKRFFKQVREVNKNSDSKVRVLAADPPIDWSKINTPEAFYEFLGQRDQYYADLVISEVLGKKQKALLVMGSGHFNRLKTHKHGPDNPIISILKSSDKNLVLINMMTIDGFPNDLLPSMKKGELIETQNPIFKNIKIGAPFIEEYPFSVQTDALLYLGDMKDLSYETHCPFDDQLYEIELNRRKNLINFE